VTNNAAVPRIIHQVWIGRKAPAIITQCLKTVQEVNSTFEYYFWDEEKLLNDFCEQFPNQKDRLLKLLNLQISSAAKVDLIRFIILYEIGGIYIDADFQFINPIPHLFLESEVILAAEPFGLTNALIGMTPRHPLAKSMIDKVWSNICGTDITSTNIVSMTGPVQFQKVVNSIALYNKFKTFILPPHIIGLVPFQKKYFLKKFYSNSNFENNLPADIIAIHHYEGSWKPTIKSLVYPIVYPIKSFLLRKFLFGRQKNEKRYV
jgi:mannosyltransferase OCH1-like enzyme